jgi:hypothetical protein
VLGCDPRPNSQVAIRRVLLGPGYTGREAGRSGGDDQRSIRTHQGLAECLDGAAIGIASALEVARESDVVLVGGVDDPVGGGRTGAQAVEIIERSAMHLCSGRGEGSGRGVRAGEPD